MITNAGKDVITQFFGGQVKQLAASLAVGVGTTAAAVGDTKLAHEVYRATITSISADTANKRIVFKATIPAGLIGSVTEAGLFVLPVDSYIARVLLLTGVWTGGTVVANTTDLTVLDPTSRATNQSIKVDAGPNATTTASMAQGLFDLSTVPGNDSVAVAFRADANLSTVKLRLGSSATDYREFTFTPTAAGYQTVRADFSTGVNTGAVDLSNINYVAVLPTAKAAGATSLYLDSLRIENNSRAGEALVARSVLSTFKRIDASVPTEIEYSLKVTA